MGFEFIMVHSGVFMSMIGRSWKGWLLFICFYGVFALIFNTMVNGNQILILYGIVVLNRMLPNILYPDKTDGKKKAAISSFYAMVYILLLLLVVFSSSHISKMGLTDDFLETSGYSNLNLAGGLFSDEPHVPMCFGVLYYLALTFVEVILIVRRVKRALRISFFQIP
jgi:hypothetical protein